MSRSIDGISDIISSPDCPTRLSAAAHHRQSKGTCDSSARCDCVTEFRRATARSYHGADFGEDREIFSELCIFHLRILRTCASAKQSLNRLETIVWLPVRLIN